MNNDLCSLLEDTLENNRDALIPIALIVAITGDEWLTPANNAALRLNARVKPYEHDRTLAIITRT